MLVNLDQQRGNVEIYNVLNCPWKIAYTFFFEVFCKILTQTDFNKAYAEIINVY